MDVELLCDLHLCSISFARCFKFTRILDISLYQLRTILFNVERCLITQQVLYSLVRSSHVSHCQTYSFLVLLLAFRNEGESNRSKYDHHHWMKMHYCLQFHTTFQFFYFWSFCLIWTLFPYPYFILFYLCAMNLLNRLRRCLDYFLL